MGNTTQLAYTGAYFDPITAGYPLGSGYRWYLPGLMRFNAPDHSSPFGAGGFHPYTYCGADPANRSDPSGHAWESAISEGLGELAREVPEHENPVTAPSGTVIGGSIAEASASGQPASSLGREADLARAAFGRWRHVIRTSKDSVSTLQTMLSSMGEPIKTVDEFFDHFQSGRVVVEAHADARYYRSGHSSFYYMDGTYELLLKDDARVTTRYKAKYPTYRETAWGNRPDQRAYIRVSDIPEGLRAQVRQILSGKIQHMIDLGHIHVLDQRYSEQFMRAFEQERFSFMHQPYSYGLRYNCHRFVLEVMKRLRDLSD